MTTLTKQAERVFTPREIKLAGPAIASLRHCRSIDEAINVVALIAKTVIEDEPRERLYRRYWP